MSQIVILKKNNENLRSSVYGSYEYGCKHAIAGSKESMLRKRGFSMTDDEIKNMLFNLPKEFKPFVRFIADETQVKHFGTLDETVKVKFEEAKENMTKTVDENKELLELLSVNIDELDEAGTVEYKNKLKLYAKENEIKIHPALKDVTKIVDKIKGNV